MLDRIILTFPWKNKCTKIAKKIFKTKTMRELALPCIKTNFKTVINCIELAQEQTNRSMRVKSPEADPRVHVTSLYDRGSTSIQRGGN